MKQYKTKNKMKIKTLGKIALLAIILKGCLGGCPEGKKFDAGKVNSFETPTAMHVYSKQEVPSPEMLPGYLNVSDYFKKDINGDGILDTICVYKGGNVFYMQGHQEKVLYNRIMPESPEAKEIQKSHPNLEIIAGD